MSLNKIWRAVAYSTDQYRPHDEVHVFVDAPDPETAKSRIYKRLSEEWELASDFIEFYNFWSEAELCDMANGPLTPLGLPLFESGAGFKGESVEVYYDREPLILVASPHLREVLESALQEVKS
ncbi:hypothetical protein FR097_10490 [Salmonella enterica]|uniref:Uncharacterized protein n=1 Tax=Salmonella enterica TaxID=28901 RepID=A0A5Y6C027_SALER|nr:hypothetical protein [Salmonella enterica]